MNTKPVLKLTLVSYFNTTTNKLVSGFVMADYSTGKAVVTSNIWALIK